MKNLCVFFWAIDTTIVSALTSQAAPRQHKKDNTQARHYGMRKGPRNGRAQNSSNHVAAAWSFVELKHEAVGAKKQQGSSANSLKPEPARAQTRCAKPSTPLPSSRNGPDSLLMPPSPPLQQPCYARTPPPTTTWMVSSHYAAKSSPTCHRSPLPPAEPQPSLKEHGLDLATPPLRRLETDQ